MRTHHWQKSSYCGEGDACLNVAATMDRPWQKSSHCAQGDSCVHVSAAARTIKLTESSDASGAILSATPTTWAALLHALKENANRV
ncbi:DUF397 domain-containing protein [Streptomyces spiramyceticus]|uniref:DUF397 domain-containing protein n=1 Tax=Streptomyces spiramyceticus TaxID=299717 RepID=UPI00237B799E|nr:DUF397 domain-containing protein [Streptomyces spiramyceticus]